MYLHVKSFPSFHSAVIVQKQNKMETWNIVSFYQSNSEIWYFVHRCWRTWSPPPLPIQVVDAFLDKDSFKVLYTTCSIWNIRKFIEKKTIYLKQPLHAYGFICKEGYLNRLFSVNFRYLKWNFVCIWLKRNFHHKVKGFKLGEGRDGLCPVLKHLWIHLL